MSTTTQSKSGAGKWLIVLAGIINILAAFYAFMNPLATDLLIPVFIGLVFVIEGGVICFDYFFGGKKEKSGWTLFFSICLILLGILIVTRDLFGLFTITYFVAYMTAAALIVGGCFRSIESFSLKKDGMGPWWAVLCLGILDVIIGVILFLNPLTLGYYAGAGLLVSGINDLVLAFAS